MRGSVLTYSSSQLWVLNKGDLNFCVCNIALRVVVDETLKLYILCVHIHCSLHSDEVHNDSAKTELICSFLCCAFWPQKREKTKSKGFKVGGNTAAGAAISFLANTNKAGMCGTSVCCVISITFSILQWETASQHDCVLLSSNRKQKSTSVANILIRQPHEARKSKYLGIFSPTCIFAGSHFKINI